MFKQAQVICEQTHGKNPLFNYDTLETEHTELNELFAQSLNSWCVQLKISVFNYHLFM